MDIVTADSVVEITGAKKVAGAKLKSKKKIACDILIMAIGVWPNLDVIKGTGIEAKQGIIVDNKMQTNIGVIFMLPAMLFRQMICSLARSALMLSGHLHTSREGLLAQTWLEEIRHTKAALRRTL